MSFAFLVTALLFAGRAVRRPRRAPGAVAHRLLAVPGHGRVALFAVVNGEEFSSYYIFYGSLFFAVAYVATLRFAYERHRRLLRAAGYQRRAVLVGTGEHIEDVAHALAAGRRGPHQRHRLRLAARRGPTTACARWARWRTSATS